MAKSAFFLYDSRGAEIRHRSGLSAPDPFIYLQPEEEPAYVYFDAREYSAQKEKLEKMKNGVKIEQIETTNVQEIIKILRSIKINKLKVSFSLPYALAKEMEKNGISLEVYDYAAEREIKTEKELQYITDAQNANESAFELVWETLRQSIIRNGKLYFNDMPLTSEIIKSIIQKHLLEKNYSCPEGIIVSCGLKAAQPHNEGSGNILPNQTIIVDVFPRSQKTGFFGDMTRTFVKGTAPKEIQKMHEAVSETQKMIIEKATPGESCQSLHRLAADNFRRLGFKTGADYGFIHGTGHSLGLEIHEDPRLNLHSESVIKPGMAFTVEPGLYYPSVGGVRIEDIIIFQPNGKKQILSNFNKSYIIP